jgi:hypothetical protein
MDWLLVLGLKEGLVECATLCVKSWVILTANWVETGKIQLCLKPSEILNLRSSNTLETVDFTPP